MAGPKRTLKQQIARRHERLGLRPWEPTLSVRNGGKREDEWPHIALGHPIIAEDEERQVKAAVEHAVRKLLNTHPDFKVKGKLPASYTFRQNSFRMTLPNRNARIGFRLRLPLESDAFGEQRMEQFVREVGRELENDVGYWKIMIKYARMGRRR